MIRKENLFALIRKSRLPSSPRPLVSKPVIPIAVDEPSRTVILVGVDPTCRGDGRAYECDAGVVAGACGPKGLTHSSPPSLRAPRGNPP